MRCFRAVLLQEFVGAKAVELLAPAHRVNTRIQSVGLAPAQLSFDTSGLPRSVTFDDIYHSAAGAAGQSREVFLAGNGLPERWRGRSSFTLIETGFGFGVNFLTTWSALRSDPAAPARLHYIAAEQYPVSREHLERFYAGREDFAHLARELLRVWPPLVHGFHRIELDDGHIALTLLFGDAAEMLAELDARADALYLDGFAPQKNPAMWSEAVFRELDRLSAAGTTAATWTIAGAVRAQLACAGFRTEKRPGFGGKREMLVAQKVDGQRQPPPAEASDKHVIVIGAGLAGVWCSQALARRGWQVDLIERHTHPAQAASGNAVGALRPALNLADNANARLARAAFLLTVRQLRLCPSLDPHWAQSGVLHVATGAGQGERMQRIVTEHAFPADYVAAVDAHEATRRAGHPITSPGWWLPLGGWADPAGLCTALLRRADRITCRLGRVVCALTRVNDTWHVLDQTGCVIAEAPTVIVAAAYESHLGGTVRTPPLVCVRGQVSYLPASGSRRLDIVVCGDGYVAPLPAGGHCVGATFQPDDSAVALRCEDHAQNLARLERMLPGFGRGLQPASLAGRAAVRTATADRIPVCGATRCLSNTDSDADGLYLLTGLGARGLIWAPLCAEVLASTLAGEPNPVERSLIKELDPSRLYARAPL